MIRMQRERFPASTSSAGFVIAALVFTWFWHDYLDFWIDDAFITLRYSRNLSEGFGPVYNPGEYVEGYTSFLWMLLAALPFPLFPEKAALVVLKVLELLFGLAILYRVWSFPGPAAPARRWGVLLLATHPDFIVNCGDGMETALFMFLIVECARSMQSGLGRRNGIVVGLLTTGLVWTRPESLPLLLALPAIQVVARWSSLEEREALVSWLIGFGFAAFLPIVLHEAWRWVYYGHPFPNTYYAKVVEGNEATRIKRGLAELGRFFNPKHIWMVHFVLWVALPLALIALWRVTKLRSREAFVWLATLWLFLLFRLSFNVWSGTETMGHHRFVTPAWILLIIMADEGARFVWRGHGRLMLAAACVAGLYFNVTGHRSHLRSFEPYKIGLERGHMKLGYWLRENYPESYTFAIGDAGATPFFSRLRAIDLWGLNDGTISHMPGNFGTRPGTADYALGREPELVVLWNKHSFLKSDEHRVFGWAPFDRAIAKHPDFKRDYRFIREFVFRERVPGIPGYHLDVFERRSLARKPSRAGGS